MSAACAARERVSRYNPTFANACAPLLPKRIDPLPKRIDDSCLDPTRVSSAAVAVIDRLRRAGFEAYLVGGCVRDLLLGRSPKDFDVASNATPEEVRALFCSAGNAATRARIVGRRFRIAHVRVQREVIEVSTFRRAGAEDDDYRPLLSSEGVILRDNAYGGIDEDAFRRDFTVNALYYDPVGHVILDYCDGLADIARRTLRLIGDPASRFREDPVRILRAVRFAAKLGLDLHRDTEQAIAPSAAMLAAVPPARLFDEFGKLFLSGDGLRTFDLLDRYGLLRHLLPGAKRAWGADKRACELPRLALANTDSRVGMGKPVTGGFLLAAFLWQEFVRQAPSDRVAASDEELDQAAVAVLRNAQSTLAFPRRHAYFVRDVWRLQSRLEVRTQRSVPQLLEHRRFRAAYDFLALHADLDASRQALADWWTEAQTLDPNELAERLPRERRPRRRRRRRGSRGGQGARSALAASNSAVAAP